MRPDMVAGPMERKWSRSKDPPGAGEESGFAAESGLAGVGLVRAWAAADAMGVEAAAAIKDAAHARRARAANTEYLLWNRTEGAWMARA